MEPFTSNLIQQWLTSMAQPETEPHLIGALQAYFPDGDLYCTCATARLLDTAGWPSEFSRPNEHRLLKIRHPDGRIEEKWGITLNYVSPAAIKHSMTVPSYALDGFDRYLLDIALVMNDAGYSYPAIAEELTFVRRAYLSDSNLDRIRKRVEFWQKFNVDLGEVADREDQTIFDLSANEYLAHIKKRWLAFLAANGSPDDAFSGFLSHVKGHPDLNFSDEELLERSCGSCDFVLEEFTSENVSEFITNFKI